MTTNSILITAATRDELKAWPGSDRAQTLVTGVGIPQTLVNLGIYLQSHPCKYILNIGIAGGYPGRRLSVGDIVLGTSEIYGDVGMENPAAGGFQHISEYPFGEDYSESYSLHSSPGFHFEGFGFGIHEGRGVTVNTCTGQRETGIARRDLQDGLFESMEGAAVAHLGKELGVPVTEIRALSNLASERDMKPQNIKTALANLHLYLTCFKNQYEKKLLDSDFSLP